MHPLCHTENTVCILLIRGPCKVEESRLVGEAYERVETYITFSTWDRKWLEWFYP